MRLCLFVLASLVVFLSSSCQPSQTKAGNSTQRWMTQNGKIKVLGTIAMIDDLVKHVGGEFVDTISLIKGELNPHTYQLVKGDDEKLAFADLVFYNGLGLEHGPSLQNFLAHSPKAVGLGNLILKRNPELILLMDEQPDPHIWMDVSLWAKTIEDITEALIKVDPIHAKNYKSNAENFKKALQKTHEKIKTMLKAIPEKQRYLVSSHDAFNYFARAYLAEEQELQENSWRKRVAAPEGLAPDSQLSPVHLQQILDFLKKNQVYVLFPESNVSKDSIKKILDAGTELGIHLKISNNHLYADAMGEPGSEGDSYENMLLHNASTIANHLKLNHSHE